MFLPVNNEEVKERGWDRVDFVLVCGDAYVDHPSFGHAIISRVLEKNGYKVGILAQPDWRTPEAFKVFGRPRLGFLISPGNIDSMVNRYTAAKKPRSTDVYSPGGRAEMRPNRPTIVYTNMIRRAYKNMPIIIGGLESSLRRFAHYDYWDDRVRASVLVDSGADLLIYGMGERPIVEIADAMNNGININDITFVRGTCYLSEEPDGAEVIASFEEVAEDKRKYAKAFMRQYEEQDPIRGKRLAQRHGKTWVVQNSPQPPLSQEEMDAVYALPYMRTYHPMYEKMGGVPAITEIKNSITSVRGCFGACNFCALTFHQGRIIQARSHESIINEAKAITEEPDFKGYINDVGGPTANFRQPACNKQPTKGACVNKMCLYPKRCDNLLVSHKDYLELLRKLRALPKVKKVFIRSGLRYDYLLYDKDDTFFRELVQHHISGQLKVAPEHISSRVLDKMGKPPREVYDRFVLKYKQLNESMGKEQYIVPYLMSSHPGSDIYAAIELAEYLHNNHITPEQVQDFYPTPGTLSTCMYYTGLDPRDMQEVYVPRTPHEKAMQRALLQYKNPKNYNLVYEALVSAGREDLIGNSSKCLIRPRVTADSRKMNQRKKPTRSDNVNGKQRRGSTNRSGKPDKSPATKSKASNKKRGRGRG